MSKKEKLKRYQKEKFQNYIKINDLVINNNEAYLFVKVNSLDDVISKYSIRGREVISNDFAKYIEEIASYILFDYPLVLEICNNSFTPEEKILIREVIRKHFSLLTISKKTELKRIRRKGISLLFIGLIVFELLLLIYNLKSLLIFKDILIFIASFSLWQFAELILFEEDSLKEDIIKYSHISNVRVIYNKERV